MRAAEGVLGKVPVELPKAVEEQEKLREQLTLVSQTPVVEAELLLAVKPEGPEVPVS
jgi:hypothetical protein